MRRTTLLALVAVGFPAVAHADELQVSTEEYATWPAAVAALQAMRGSEGRVVHVVVRDGTNERIPCVRYGLALDAVASQAFVVGACDASSGATEVRLARRAALFDHTDDMPRPLAAGITATEVRTGATAGGAANEGGSVVTCTVAVHPYIQDLEHGGRVFLSPERYVLRPLAAGVTASPESDGWLLRGSSRAALTLEYDVLDAQRLEVVLHDRATLSCGTERLRGDGARDAHQAAPNVIVVSGAGASSAESNAASTPERPRYTWLFQYGVGAVGVVGLNAMTWLGDGTARRNGSDLIGLGTQTGGGGGFGEFAFAFDLNWVYASVETGWYANSNLWELNARATIAASVRLGRVLLYAGPTAIGSYLNVQDFYDRDYYSGVMINLAATAGLQFRFEDWNAEHRRFTVWDIFLQGTIPITGSEGFIVAGFGVGQGY